MTDREALKFLMGLTDEEITDLGGFPDDDLTLYPQTGAGTPPTGR